MLSAPLLAALAVALALPARGRDRLTVIRPAASGVTTSLPPRRRWWTSPPFASAVAALAALQVFRPPTGLVWAAAAAVAAHQWVSRAESAARREWRLLLERQLPLAVDLIVACLVAGRPPAVAWSTVAGAVPEPLASELRSVAAQLDLGTDPEAVWHQLARDPLLGPLGRAFTRAARSGSSVTTALQRCSEDLRRRRRSVAQARARSVGVKAAGPLGVCFLPAFVVVGIVPTVVGLFSSFVA